MAKEINEGSNGFHLFTVVTDGYGNLISEDHRGFKIAEVSARDADDNDPAPFTELARLTLAVLNGDAEPLDPRAKEM
jgi:hypothetical protein